MIPGIGSFVDTVDTDSPMRNQLSSSNGLMMMAEDDVSEQSVCPSYTIAYGQLQDLVRTQTSILAKLQCRV